MEVKTGMSVDDLQNGWRMRTGVQDQKSEWNPGGSSVTVMGRTKNCDNPSTHSTDENTEGKLGGKTPTGSTHALSISLSVPLSPPPMAREGVLGRMAFVQLRAPPGYFRQAKVWGGRREVPPPIQGLFQSELEEPGSRGSCPKPRQRCYRLSTGVWAALCLSVLSAPTHLE